MRIVSPEIKKSVSVLKNLQIPFCFFVCGMGRVVFRAIERQCLDFSIFVNVNLLLVRLAENDDNSGVVWIFLKVLSYCLFLSIKR